MKIIHLSDLHLGKRINEFSMIEDQKYILVKIMNIIDDEKPDVVIVAGDVYDKAVPSTEAVELFDDFLVKLANRKLQTFIISGNHDSSERLAFGNRLLDASGIHLSPVYAGQIKPIVLQDQFGEVRFYMLPFIKPAHVRQYLSKINNDKNDEEPQIISYTDALQFVIKKMNIDTTCRNILITHQFVTGALRSDSEDISVGGTDNVDATVFEDFDYVALGHIHRPQNVGMTMKALTNESKTEIETSYAPKIRYCGTPLKYSFSEANHKKSVTIVEINEKGSLYMRTAPLQPLRDMVEIKGNYEELTCKKFYAGTTYSEDYMHITLTDEEDIPDAISKLRTIYHNLMKLDYDNKRTRHKMDINQITDVEKKSPLELFSEFYNQQNGSSMSEEQTEFIKAMIEDIWEGAK